MRIINLKQILLLLTIFLPAVWCYAADTYDGYSASWNFFLSFDQMCYCLDSYLGLGYDYVDNTLYPNEHPVCWKVFRVNYSPNPTSYYYYHQLYVEYGQLVTNHEWPIVD